MVFLNAVWLCGTLLILLYAALTGRAGDTARALLESGGSAVSLMMTLLGTMTLWSGLMETLTDTDDARRVGQALRKLLRGLFPGVTDEYCWEAMSLNLSANLLGLGSAATPAGLEAAKRLASQGEPGLRALATLLALNNSSLQVIPTTVIGLRAAAGSAAPADIWPASLIASLASTLTAALLMAWLHRRRARYG